jgi:carboxymethylenebutenolidase
MNRHQLPSDIFGLAKVVPPLSRVASCRVPSPQGYTLAAGPVRADVIHTDTEGLDAGEAKVNVCGRA